MRTKVYFEYVVNKHATDNYICFDKEQIELYDYDNTWLWYPALKYSDSKKAVGIQDRISIAFSFKSYNWISV